MDFYAVLLAAKRHHCRFAAILSENPPRVDLLRPAAHGRELAGPDGEAGRS